MEAMTRRKKRRRNAEKLKYAHYLLTAHRSSSIFFVLLSWLHTVFVTRANQPEISKWKLKDLKKYFMFLFLFFRLRKDW